MSGKQPSHKDKASRKSRRSPSPQAVPKVLVERGRTSTRDRLPSPRPSSAANPDTTGSVSSGSSYTSSSAGSARSAVFDTRKYQLCKVYGGRTVRRNVVVDAERNRHNELFKTKDMTTILEGPSESNKKLFAKRFAQKVKRIKANNKRIAEKNVERITKGKKPLDLLSSCSKDSGVTIDGDEPQQGLMILPKGSIQRVDVERYRQVKRDGTIVRRKIRDTQPADDNDLMELFPDLYGDIFQRIVKEVEAAQAGQAGQATKSSRPAPPKRAASRAAVRRRPMDGHSSGSSAA